MFENNGLFVTNCIYHGGTVSFSFSDTTEKKYYTESMIKKNKVTALTPVRARALFEWISTVNSKVYLVHSSDTPFTIDYEKTTGITFRKLPEFEEAKILKARLFFEDKLMCFVEQPLAEIELI
jgi:hypothetical protein